MARATLVAFTLLAAMRYAGAVELGLPADCTLGEDCFFQQFSDMQPGPGVSDPFCGNAAYDGHEGADLRVLSMVDVARGVPVVAMADGVVLRIRDGEPDRLVITAEDQAAVASKECGNGVVVDHGDGIEVQYCHMRQDSLSVPPGDRVERGANLGEVGASGFAQFPHVHVGVRLNGEDVDPVTGRALSEGCVADPADRAPLLAADVMAALGEGGTALLASGLAAGPVDHAALAVSGPPQAATSASPNIVGWAWFINLRQGDRIRIVLTGPDGQVLAESTTEPLDRKKASYSAYVGKRGAPPPGDYGLSVSVLRDGKPILEEDRRIDVQ